MKIDDSKRCSSTKEDQFLNYLTNQQLQCLALFSSIKPFLCWCILCSFFSILFIIFKYFIHRNEPTATFFSLIIPNIAGQLTFFLLLLSRVMSITIEQYLSASVTLFNDLIITIPRYILWELIFTSRWIWLSLHYFSATYSIIKLWNLCTFLSLRLSPFLMVFFFVTGALSFIRFFGKNQNIFFISSRTQLKYNKKLYINTGQSYIKDYFEIVRYFLINGGEGNIINALIFTVLSFILTVPIFIIGVNIPGVAKFYQLLIKIYSSNNFFISKRCTNFNFYSVLTGYLVSLFVVTFYWYCIELQSNNFRSLGSFNISELFLTNIPLNKDNRFSENFIPSGAFLKFVNSINKRIFFFTNSKFSFKKIIRNFLYFLSWLLTIPTIFPFWYLYFPYKFKYEAPKEDLKVTKLQISIIDEWHTYEYRLLYILEKLQKQLEYIFSTVLLLDSSIHTRVTAMSNIELQIILQSTLGIERKFSISQIDLNDWFSNFFSIEHIEEKTNHIPKSINDWWYFNILLSENLNNPKLNIPNSNNMSISNLKTSQSIIYRRNEIFKILLSQSRKENICKKKESISSNNSYTDVQYNLMENEVTSQVLFLMQEMTLYTIDLCILYTYCYNRFLAKNLVINGSKNEINMHSVNQFINMSTEIKNRIFCAFEVGLLSSPYLHPIFEQEITRLYRNIEDSIGLLLSLV